MKLRYYTVIGIYADNNQPWVGYACATNARQAAIKAAENVLKEQEWADEDQIKVVEVIAGKRQGRLGNDLVLTLKELRGE